MRVVVGGGGSGGNGGNGCNDDDEDDDDDENGDELLKFSECGLSEELKENLLQKFK